MRYLIKELRENTGLTQKAFADLYDIPLSTLRKWEQGEASPAEYVLNLIARTLPSTNLSLRRIESADGQVFYYDEVKKTIADSCGNTVHIQVELAGVKEQNLALYIQELFEEFESIRERFYRDCEFDKKEDIIWRR